MIKRLINFIKNIFHKKNKKEQTCCKNCECDYKD